MINLQCTIEVNDVINNLNRIKEYSSSSLSSITKEMAQETRLVAQNILMPDINGGQLIDSLKILNNYSQGMSVSILYTDSKYARYYYYGTTGEWYTHESDENLVVSKMDKYGMKPNSGGFYKFHGQKAHPFLEIALANTQNSIISLAKSKYIENISKGTR